MDALIRSMRMGEPLRAKRRAIPTALALVQMLLFPDGAAVRDRNRRPRRK